MSKDKTGQGCHEIHVQGIVQGVGFRPFVFRLAHEHKLVGSVANNERGVLILIYADEVELERFLSALKAEAPPAARISHLSSQPVQTHSRPSFFTIAKSEVKGQASTAISPDLATCPDCVQEIFSTGNRRYRYPFTNCTNCGPRFTITAAIPYDRPNTSMRVFPMCPACLREYENPMDRRFHAQPNACPTCGPTLAWLDNKGAPLIGDPLQEAANALSLGAILAIKGLGGFHLAVDAGNEESVALLRQRKKRSAKPLAVMVANLAALQEICQVQEEEARLLNSVAHPIVLLNKRDTSLLAPNLAPGLNVLGVMLANTPLHHLLLAENDAPKVLVMTSGNASDAPICRDNEEALSRLAGYADFFLLHNREILTRVDDSVQRVMAGKPRMIRRARGYAPAPIAFPEFYGEVLACGAEMKNTFCLTRQGEAFLSQHIGELRNNENYDNNIENIKHLQAALECDPNRLICDLHPDYHSTRYAQAQPLPPARVQHHYAHALAVMAEHGLKGPLLALVLDGTGYGDDGSIFGGEVYQVDLNGYKRLAHLAPLPLPGADMAVLEPWRLALALMHDSKQQEGIETKKVAQVEAWPASLLSVPEQTRTLVITMLEKGLNSPLSTSCGRLFDAVSALLGLCSQSQYEGHAAMLLEAQAFLAGKEEKGVRYPIEVRWQENSYVVETAAMCRAMVQDIANGVSIPAMALGFHQWLGASLQTVLAALRGQTNLNQVVLAGGCMQNKLLFEWLCTTLGSEGFSVFAGEEVPMNDGGIAFGQAYGGWKQCV